jgi:tripartite-type tricarboxylate transporter receptor subunit TctC
MKRKMISQIVLVIVALAVSLVPAGSLMAQDYPKGIIQLVVPFAPGGATDIFWRILAEAISKEMGTTIAVLNKTGGGGIVGMSTVVNSKPDGYSICAGNSDTLSITPLFTKDLPFDTIQDLTYIAKCAIFPHTISVRTESPFKTLEDLVAFAKANPKKLKSLTPGVGTAPHMAINLFNDDAKVEFVPVVFGGTEGVAALIGGHVDFGFISIPPIKSQIEARNVRILAFLLKQRHPLYPTIPTAYKKGYRRSVLETAVGLVGPKGLPAGIVKKWEEAAQAALKDPNVISAIQKFDFIVDFKSGEEYKKAIVDDMAIFKKLLSKSGEQK